MRITQRLTAASTALLLLPAFAAPTVNDVGDVDSFGRSVKFLGLKVAPTVWMHSTCTPGPDLPLTGNARCVVVSPTAFSANFDQANLVTFRLPGFSTSSLVCPSFSTRVNFQVGGPQASGVIGTGIAIGAFSLNYQVTIESAVLTDPSFVYPATGQPLNGKVTYDLNGFTESHSLRATDTFSKSGILSQECLMPLIHKNLLRIYGLSSRQASSVFANPMTITIGVKGGANLLARGSYTLGVRLYGD